MNNQPWYRDGLRFRCTGCGDCCTGDPGHVWVDQSEIEALAAAVGVDVTQFKRQFTRRVAARRSLVEFPNGDCIFFDGQTRQCKVYRHRPRQCLTWPFWDSNVDTPGDWAETRRGCPGCGQGPLVPADEIDAQRRVIPV